MINRISTLICLFFICNFLHAQNVPKNNNIEAKIDSVQKEYLMLQQLFEANLNAKKKSSAKLSESNYLEYLNDSGITAIVVNAENIVVKELTYKWDALSSHLVFETESNTTRKLSGYEDSLSKVKLLISRKLHSSNSFIKERSVILAASPFKVYSIYLPETENFVPIGNDCLYEIDTDLNLYNTIKYHDGVKKMLFKPANSNREVKILGFRMDEENSMILATDILKFKHYTAKSETNIFFVYLLKLRAWLIYDSVSDSLVLSEKHPLLN